MDLIPFGSNPFSKINIKETEKDIVITIDVPDIDPKKTLVEVDENFIRLSGSGQQEKEEKGKGFYRKEHSSHSFQRVIPLPCPINADKVKAGTKDGILTIILRKKYPAQPIKMKKIPVEEE